MKQFSLFTLGLFFLLKLTAQPCSPPCQKTFPNATSTDFILATDQFDGNKVATIGRVNNNSMISIFSQEMVLQQTFEFNFTNGSDFFENGVVDSEGMVIACGRDQPNSDTENFIIRFDAKNNQVLWSKKMLEPAYTRIHVIQEKEPGGNFLAAGMLNPNGNCDGFIMELDRSTGDLVWIRQYDMSSCEIFYRLTVHNDFIYLAGTHRAFGGINTIRAGITKLDMSGNQIWTKLYFHQNFQSARTYMEGILIEDDHIYATFRGDFSGDSYSDVVCGLMKADLDGMPVWAKTYDFPGYKSEFARNIKSTEEGFLLNGRITRTDDDTHDIFVMRTDKEGKIISTRGTNGVVALGTYFLFNDRVYLGSSFAHTNNPSITDLFMISWHQDENDDDTICDMVETLDVDTEDISNPVMTVNQNLVEITANWELIDFDISSNTTSLNEETWCADLVATKEHDFEILKEAVSIHPNPAIDYVNIKSAVDFEKILIYDVTGKLLAEQSFSEQIDISELPLGILFLKFVNEEERIINIQKLVKPGYPRP